MSVGAVYSCIADFVAQDSGEISLRQGQVVRIVEPEEADNPGWVYVESDGQAGFAPLSYLQPAVAQQAYPVQQQQQQQRVQSVGYPQPGMQQNFSSNDLMQHQQQQPVMQQQFSGNNLMQHQQQQPVMQQPMMQQYQSSSSSNLNNNYDNNSYKHLSIIPGGSMQPVGASNPSNFNQTLEFWKERERRFFMGEKQKLPQPRKREYYYWDRAGNRHGPLTETEMKLKFDKRQLAVDTPITLSTETPSGPNRTLSTKPLEHYFPDISTAFMSAPIVDQVDNMWCYLDDSNNIQGPFSSEMMRDWFQQGYFSSDTRVRLAHQNDNELLALGTVFPEGVGAFLTLGNAGGLRGASSSMQMNDMISALPDFATQPPLAMGHHQQHAPMLGASAQNANFGTSLFLDHSTSQAQLNPFDTNNGNAASAAAASAFDPFATPQQPAISRAQRLNRANSNASDHGKALFMNAIERTSTPKSSQQNPQANAFGAAEMQDDWGITWDDDGENDDNDDHKEKRPAQLSKADKGDSNRNLTTMPVASENRKSSRYMANVAKFSVINNKYLRDCDNLYRFLTRPLPKELGTVQCKIIRSCVGLHVNYNKYELIIEMDDGRRGPQILRAHKHKKYGVDSYFQLCIGDVLPRDAGVVISHLIYSAFGTQFVLHNDVKAHKGKPKDLAVVTYEKNIGKGPRKMRVAIPAMKERSDGSMALHQWPHAGSSKKSHMLHALNSMDLTNLQPLINKPPVWSSKHKAWTLNFHGRVKKPSVKNFQLVRPQDHQHVVLQHGRVGTDLFTMDAQYPISLLQAFAICVSSLHFKLFVE